MWAKVGPGRKDCTHLERVEVAKKRASQRWGQPEMRQPGRRQPESVSRAMAGNTSLNQAVVQCEGLHNRGVILAPLAELLHCQFAITVLWCCWSYWEIVAAQWWFG